MDFFQFSDHFKPMTCILSVESFPDGTYGNIRIVAGNKPYLHGFNAYDAMDASDKFKTPFIPNSPYERYIPKDPNFEDFCYRCAILGETIHTYIHPETFNFWINITMLPLGPDNGNIRYCSYSQEFTKHADATIMSSLAPETSAAVLKTCIKLRGAVDFQAAVDEVIQDIRDMTDAHHCCIFLTDFAQRKCSVLSEALRKDTSLLSMKAYVNDDFIDIAATWNDTLGGSTNILINDERGWEDLRKNNPIWYNSMKPAGAKNIVMFPLKARDVTLGYIWAINFDVQRTVQIKAMLELTTFFIAAEIANYQLLRRMEILSTTDLLTGVFNRNAMNNRIDRLLSGEEKADRIGIVFADLNGLKHVNDSHGHFAGDLLLKNAAFVLQKTFEGCDVYRAGGDEFMVLAVDLPEEEIADRVQMLRGEANDPDAVSFALGYCTDAAANLRASMHTADERMYADKEHFYAMHPSRRRD